MEIKRTEELEQLLEKLRVEIQDRGNGVLILKIRDLVFPATGVADVVSRILEDNPELSVTAMEDFGDHFGRNVIVTFGPWMNPGSGKKWPSLVE